MIKIRPIGQAGNQMFSYVMGKILAERTGQEYKPPPRWLTRRRRPVTWTEEPLFFKRATSGNRLTKAEQQISAMHWIDLDAIDPSRPITILFGYFQRYELLKPYKEKIRNDWLKLQGSFFETLLDSLYIHVRRTDYVGGDTAKQGVATTIDEYARCIGEFPDAKRIVLMTDNVNDPFMKEFHKFGLPVYIDNQPWDIDFLSLASCRWMIMSQSTYSWWAGFLGRAEKIVCPMFPGTFWNRGIGLYGPASPDYPNLYVDDEPDRWTWLTE